MLLLTCLFCFRSCSLWLTCEHTRVFNMLCTKCTIEVRVCWFQQLLPNSSPFFLLNDQHNGEKQREEKNIYQNKMWSALSNKKQNINSEKCDFLNIYWLAKQMILFLQHGVHFQAYPVKFQQSILCLQCSPLPLVLHILIGI